MKTQETGFNTLLNYSLNKFLPIILMGVLLFSEMGPELWQPYVILGLAFFIGHFNFKVGYAVAICEERGLINKDD